MRSGFRKILALLGIFLALWMGIRYLLPLVLPFLLGTAIAAAAEPGVKFFCRRLGLPRVPASALAVTASVCFLTLAVLLLCALILRELGALAGIVPDLGVAARSGFASLEQWLLELSVHTPESIRPALRSGIRSAFSDGNSLLDKVLGYLLNLAGRLLEKLPDSALGIGSTVISAYMISFRLPGLKAWIAQRLGGEKLRKALQTLGRLRKTLGHFLLAQLQLSGVTFGILLVSFLLLRIPFAPVWALAVALVDILPVLGTGAVLLPWSLIALLQGSGVRAVGLLGTYVILGVVRSVLEPRLLGRQLGLDPLAMLVTLYAGYRLWGVGGMLLAPLAAVTALQLLRIREQPR